MVSLELAFYLVESLYKVSHYVVQGGRGVGPGLHFPEPDFI
jgi:hypothetical protein